MQNPRPSPQGNLTAPNAAAQRKRARRPTHAELHAFAAQHAPVTVIVRAEYAIAFRQPPRDGNTYLVEDPKQRGVIHETDAAGRYTRWSDDHPLQIKVEPKKVFGAKKPAVQIEQLPKGITLLAVPATDPLPMRLINLDRVMQITGFGKSFLYAQRDFPPPVKMGKSKKAAVRWSEAEVAAWVTNLLDKRHGEQGDGGAHV